MALSNVRRAELAKLTLQRSGMTTPELSQQIGYAPSSLGVYLHAKYGNALTAKHDGSENTRAIRAAIKEYADAWEAAQPKFEVVPAHRTKDFLDVRRCCMNALERGSAYIIDGPPGTQKTFSLRATEREINQLPDGSRAIYVYARVAISPQNFLREICDSAGIPSRGTIDMLIRKLRFFLCTGRVLLIVDEAQHLDHKGLEVLRQLLDLPPYFGVVLAGSHDLTQRLSHWEMEQWRSRVRRTLYLDGPSVAEARAILRAELEPLVGPQSDAQCDGVIDGCWAIGSRTHKDGDKLKPRKFKYISARDLFFTIEGIQQQIQKAGASGQIPAAQKAEAVA